MHVFITVPEFSADHKGLFAAGKFYPYGESGPHEVTSAEYAKLKANKRIAVRDATSEEVRDGVAKAQTSAGPAGEVLTEEEQDLLASFRSAQKQDIEVTLVRMAEIDQAHTRAAELESEVRNIRNQVKDLEASAKTRAGEFEASKTQLEASKARIAELESQLKAAHESKKK